MPTDLDVIERRLRSTLVAVADQTTLDEARPLATVTPLAPTADRRRGPLRSWMVALAVAAAVLLLVGFVAVARGRDAGLTTAATPPNPVTVLVATYLPDGTVTSGANSTTILAGQDREWTAPGGTVDIRWDAKPFPLAVDPNGPPAFTGNDGLSFELGPNEQVQTLTQQLDDIKARYTHVFEQAKTAPPDQQEILRSQKDALVEQSAELDAKLATAEQSQPIWGGRKDVTVSLSGSVGVVELTKVAHGLRVRTTDGGSTGTPTTPAAASPLDPSAARPAPPALAVDPPTSPPGPPTTTHPLQPTEPGGPAFTAPLPDGWVLGTGQHSSVGPAPFAADFAEPLISLPPQKQPDPGFWTWTYTSAVRSSGTSLVATVYEWQHLGGTLVSDGGSIPPRPDTTPAGLSVVDLGRRCASGAAETPGSSSCGRTIAVWNQQTVEVLVLNDGAIDALAYARSLAPAS